MGGGYHRMYTLGHDTILGWIFGTMNILTDVITLNSFKSYRVIRKSKMVITPEIVPMGASFVASKIFDIVISLVHGLFRKAGESKGLYEVRTRKILLISNAIATSSTIINAGITGNPKNLDIGSLLNMVTHLFSDVRFIAKIKQEFIGSEISDRVKVEIDEIDRMFGTI